MELVFAYGYIPRKSQKSKSIHYFKLLDAHMKTILNEGLRKIRNYFTRRRLQNKNFSLIASNCNGGCILHDLGIRFNSPFINLWIEPQDFIKLLQNLPFYLSQELHFLDKEDNSSPIGLLNDVKIYFTHYKSKEEALTKWNERVKRINYNNLFILFTDRDSCSYRDLCDFEKLPYKNKIVFTHIPYPEFKSAQYIKGWESENSVGLCFEYTSLFKWTKHYDEFDFISWFNNQPREH